MKVGIMGTQGVGKTTLLNALREEELFKNYAFCDEVTRWVKNLGFNINESGDDVTQELIAMKHVYNLHMNGKMITDRTIVDCLAYSMWLYDNKKINTSTLNMVKDVYNNIIWDYDYLFYIPPEFPVEDDGVRSTNEDFRNKICDNFDHIFSHTIGPKPLELRGSVEQRINNLKGDIFG